MNRILLDAGALIALDRDERRMWGHLAIAERDRVALVTHGGVVGQVWRRPARQARLTRALRAVNVRPLDDSLGKRAGELLAKAGTSDVVDAALVVLCRPGDRIYTSDPDDLVLLASAARLAGVDVIPV